MVQTVRQGLDLSMSAAEAWKIYGTLEFSKIMNSLNIVDKVEADGNGDVGTVITIKFPPGIPHFTTYKERYTKVDDENRVKEAVVIEGGNLEAVGLHITAAGIEVAEKTESSCVVTLKVEFDIKEGADFNAAMGACQPVVALMTAVVDHLNKTTK